MIKSFKYIFHGLRYLPLDASQTWWSTVVESKQISSSNWNTCSSILCFLYFYLIPFQTEMLYFLQHYMYLTAGDTEKIWSL